MRALSLLWLGWRREEDPLPDSDMRPARTLVRACAQLADLRPEAAFGLGQVLGTDLLSALVVAAPADEIRPVTMLDVVAIGLDDRRRRRLPVLAGSCAVDLFQEPRGAEWSKRPRASVEQACQRRVVIPKVHSEAIVGRHLEQQRHVRVPDGASTNS